MGTWGYHPYKWSYNPLLMTGRGPPYNQALLSLVPRNRFSHTVFTLIQNYNPKIIPGGNWSHSRLIFLYMAHLGMLFFEVQGDDFNHVFWISTKPKTQGAVKGGWLGRLGKKKISRLEVLEIARK